MGNCVWRELVDNLMVRVQKKSVMLEEVQTLEPKSSILLADAALAENKVKIFLKLLVAFCGRQSQPKEETSYSSSVEPMRTSPEICPQVSYFIELTQFISSAMIFILNGEKKDRKVLKRIFLTADRRYKKKTSMACEKNEFEKVLPSWQSLMWKT